MAAIDIRNDSSPVNEIIFGDRTGKDGIVLGFKLVKPTDPTHAGEFFMIKDKSEHVNIDSVEHARNLIKALEKAIEMGWVK